MECAKSKQNEKEPNQHIPYTGNTNPMWTKALMSNEDSTQQRSNSDKENPDQAMPETDGNESKHKNICNDGELPEWTQSNVSKGNLNHVILYAESMGPGWRWLLIESDTSMCTKSETGSRSLSRVMPKVDRVGSSQMNALKGKGNSR